MKHSRIIFSFIFLSLVFAGKNFANQNSVDRFEKLINVIDFGRSKNFAKKMKFLDERLKMDKEKKLFSVLNKFFEGMPDCYLDVALDIARNKANDLKAKSIPATKTKINEIKSKNIPVLQRQVKSALIERRYKKQKRNVLKNEKSNLDNLNKELKFFEGLGKYYEALISYLETKLGEKEQFFT